MYRLYISRPDSSSYRNFSVPRSELSTINPRSRYASSHHPDPLNSFFPRGSYLQLLNKIIPSPDDPHSLAPTTSARLDQNRISNPVRLFLKFLRVLSFSRESRDEGDVLGVFEKVFFRGTFVA